MKINLAPEIEEALIKRALELGTTPELLVMDSLKEQFVASKSVSDQNGDHKTLADFLGDHIGVLSSGEYIKGGARMSEGRGEQFTIALLKKRKHGHL